MSETSVDKERFQIEVTDEVALGRNSTVEHAKWGPLEVDQVTISAHGKRARLKSPMREDGLSIELSGDEIREQWGETIAADPFELREGDVTSYTQDFSSTDEELQATIEVSGPEDRAEPVMAHLQDQTTRVLQAMEDQKPPEECDGRYDIDWGGIFADMDTEATLDDY